MSEKELLKKGYIPIKEGYQPKPSHGDKVTSGYKPSKEKSQPVLKPPPKKP